MKNQFNVLEQLIGINPEIKTSYFNETSFSDEKVEKLFKQNQQKNSFTQKVFSDAILLGGYLVSLVYITIAFQRTVFILSFLSFFAMFLLVLFFSYYSKNKKLVSLLDYLQIFLISLNLNIKAMIIIFQFNNEELEDIVKNTEELLRIIIYDFITSNLLLLVKLEGKLKTHLFFLFMNLFTIFIVQYNSIRNHYLYLEGVVSTMYTVIFYIFRKIWEYKIRLSFAEKYKFENLFIYTNDFIQGLNGYHLNFNNDLLLYYDEKFSNFLNENLFLEKSINANNEVDIDIVNNCKSEFHDLLDDNNNNKNFNNNDLGLNKNNNNLNKFNNTNKNNFNFNVNNNFNDDTNNVGNSESNEKKVFKNNLNQEKDILAENNNENRNEINNSIKIVNQVNKLLKNKKTIQFKDGPEKKNFHNNLNKNLNCVSENLIFSETQNYLLNNNNNNISKIENINLANLNLNYLNTFESKKTKPLKHLINQTEKSNLNSNTCMQYIRSPISELNPITFFLSELKKYYMDESEVENGNKNNLKTSNAANNNSNNNNNPLLSNKSTMDKNNKKPCDKNLNNVNNNLNFNNNLNLNFTKQNSSNNFNTINNPNEDLMHYINQERTKLTKLNGTRLKRSLENGENEEVNLLSQIKSTIENQKEKKKFNESFYLGVFKFDFDDKRLENMLELFEASKEKDSADVNNVIINDNNKNKSSNFSSKDKAKENSYFYSKTENAVDFKKAIIENLINDSINDMKVNSNEIGININKEISENKGLNNSTAKKNESFTVNVNSNMIYSDNNTKKIFERKIIIENSNAANITECNKTNNNGNDNSNINNDESKNILNKKNSLEGKISNSYYNNSPNPNTNKNSNKTLKIPVDLINEDANDKNTNPAKSMFYINNNNEYNNNLNENLNLNTDKSNANNEEPEINFKQNIGNSLIKEDLANNKNIYNNIINTSNNDINVIDFIEEYGIVTNINNKSNYNYSYSNINDSKNNNNKEKNKEFSQTQNTQNTKALKQSKNNSNLGAYTKAKTTEKINEAIKQRFFDVYLRRICFSNENTVYNIIFYDVTDLISARIKIYEENQKKHKVLAKMAHEFKTPLTSIVSLISILRDSYEEAISESFGTNKRNLGKIKAQKNNQQTLDTLDLIQNLSRYVIFLTSDIIHYSNPNNISDVELNYQRINFREISTFCFDILKSLLYCNISKLRKIKAELLFDDSLDKVEFYSDEVRIKQILLNFLSNSVKFTNQGYIRLIVGKCAESKKLLFSVEDTGIGIKQEEKLLLFKDFGKIEKNNNVNSLISNNCGSGLGLSICRNLANKLQMEIRLDSAFGLGTKISLSIPFDGFNSEKEIVKGIKEGKDIDIDKDKENNNNNIKEKKGFEYLNDIKDKKSEKFLNVLDNFNDKLICKNKNSDYDEHDNDSVDFFNKKNNNKYNDDNNSNQHHSVNSINNCINFEENKSHNQTLLKEQDVLVLENTNNDSKSSQVEEDQDDSESDSYEEPQQDESATNEENFKNKKEKEKEKKSIKYSLINAKKNKLKQRKKLQINAQKHKLIKSAKVVNSKNNKFYINNVYQISNNLGTLGGKKPSSNKSDFNENESESEMKVYKESFNFNDDDFSSYENNLNTNNDLNDVNNFSDKISYEFLFDDFRRENFSPETLRFKNPKAQGRKDFNGDFNSDKSSLRRYGSLNDDYEHKNSFSLNRKEFSLFKKQKRMNSIVGSLGNNYDFLKELSKTRTKYDLIDFSEKTTVIIDINKMVFPNKHFLNKIKFESEKNLVNSRQLSFQNKSSSDSQKDISYFTNSYNKSNNNNSFEIINNNQEFNKLNNNNNNNNKIIENTNYPNNKNNKNNINNNNNNRKNSKNKLTSIKKTKIQCSNSNSKNNNKHININNYPSAEGTSRSLSDLIPFIQNNKIFEKTLKQNRKIVLLADDNHIINDSNKRIVNGICKEKQLDLEIICCSDGMDILKFILDEKIFGDVKLIITDENMEFLNGSEAVKIVRTIEERKKNKRKFIISLTCHEDISMINYIKECGADMVVSKPLNKNKIKDVFDEVFLD